MEGGKVCEMNHNDLIWGTMMNLLRELYEEQSAEPEMQNLITELNNVDGAAERAESYLEFAKNHPDDSIGAIASVLGKYELIRPYLVWDWERMVEVANITIPIQEMIQELDPDAEFSVGLDELLSEHAIMKIRSGEYAEWGILPDNMAAASDLFGKIDEVSINPLENERFEVWLTFRNVRKPG